MRFMSVSKDGGPESKVWGFFFIEIKRLFSVVLLRFEDGSRDAFHNHAFNAVSWVLRGQLREFRRFASVSPAFAVRIEVRRFTPSLYPILTARDNMHQVVSSGRTWALSVRGPWAKKWNEFIPATNQSITLTNGRVEVPGTNP